MDNQDSIKKQDPILSCLKFQPLGERTWRKNHRNTPRNMWVRATNFSGGIIAWQNLSPVTSACCLPRSGSRYAGTSHWTFCHLIRYLPKIIHQKACRGPSEQGEMVTHSLATCNFSNWQRLLRRILAWLTLPNRGTEQIYLLDTRSNTGRWTRKG